MRSKLPCAGTLATCGFALLALASGAAIASEPPFPNRAVRIIAAQQAGSAADHVARAMADALADHWGVPVVVDNRPGASGAIGTQAAARAPSAGYTLLVGGLSNVVTSPSLDPDYGVDPENDLIAIGRIARVPFVLAIHVDVPASSLADLVRHARANPGELVFATSGPTAYSRLVVERLARGQGIHLLTVEYRGAPAATLDLVAGRAHLQVNEVATMKQHADAGRIRPLAIAGDRRAAALPSVPTFAEAGAAAIPMSPWYGLFAPAGLSRETRARLDSAYRAVMRETRVRARLETLGYEPMSDEPGAFAEALRRDLATVSTFAREVGRVPVR